MFQFQHLQSLKWKMPSHLMILKNKLIFLYLFLCILKIENLPKRFVSNLQIILIQMFAQWQSKVLNVLLELTGN